MHTISDFRYGTQLTSVSVFLFYALALSVPSGYSYGAALLLLSSLIYLVRRPALHLSSEDHVLIWTLLSVFLVALLTFVIHDNKPKTLDQAIRCLLAVPILLLLLRKPPHVSFLWAGLALGAIASAGLAFWQVTWGPLIGGRATGFVTSAIPFGNMGLVLGMLCGVGLFWTCTQTKHRVLWRTVLTLGLFAGVYCSIASMSRGGWIAIPAVICLFLVAFLTRRNLLRAAILASIAAIALVVIFIMPQTGVQARYDQAVTEINSYVHDDNAISSVGVRLEAWRAALISIPEKPWLGFSYKGYSAHLQKLATAGRIDPFVQTLSNTHNNFIEVLLHQGILGLSALLALFFVPFWLFCKRLRSNDRLVKTLAISGATVVSSFFIFSLTQVILGRNNGIMFFTLSVVILWAALRHAEAKTHSNPPVTA